MHEDDENNDDRRDSHHRYLRPRRTELGRGTRIELVHAEESRAAAAAAVVASGSAGVDAGMSLDGMRMVLGMIFRPPSRCCSPAAGMKEEELVVGRRSRGT